MHLSLSFGLQVTDYVATIASAVRLGNPVRPEVTSVIWMNASCTKTARAKPHLGVFHHAES
jgi:hypothetical protein